MIINATSFLSLEDWLACFDPFGDVETYLRSIGGAFDESL